MKPYHIIPICECGEPLVRMPSDVLAFFDPPPYMKLGAPYGKTSPRMLRQSVLDALLRAQARLTGGLRLMIFDAYRPRDVQAFMVEREFAAQARLHPALDKENLAELVYQFWALPSDDPATPSPHSTGAAIDCTLMDAEGREVDMGSPIDEVSERSYPDYFAQAEDEAGRRMHANRLLLRNVIIAEGFRNHKNEWWHFSLGDQYWAWREREDGNLEAVARYGAVTDVT